MSKKPIFHDPNNRRASIVKRSVFIFGSISVLLLLVFLVSIFLRPILPLPSYFREMSVTHLLHPIKNKIHQEKKQLANIQEVHTATGKVTDALNMSAFFVEWDDSSFASLQENIDKIDTLVSEELSVTETGVTLLYPDKFKRTMQYIHSTKESLRVIPLVNNYNSTQESWDKDILQKVLSDPEKRNILEENLMSFVETNHLDGLSIDFEDLLPETFPFYYTFLEDMGNRLHSDKLSLETNVPLHNDSFDYTKISSLVDMMVVMAYDEHWSSASPGPVSSLSWYQEGVTEILRTIPKEKVSIAIGNYGYDWTK